jgi:hypothetical protein
MGVSVTPTSGVYGLQMRARNCSIIGYTVFQAFGRGITIFGRVSSGAVISGNMIANVKAIAGNQAGTGSAAPASGTQYTFRYSPKTIVVSGGDVTGIQIDGADIGTRAGHQSDADAHHGWLFTCRNGACSSLDRAHGKAADEIALHSDREHDDRGGD